MMKKITGSAVIWACFSALAGCTKPYYHLNPAVQNQFTSTMVVLGISQSELNTNINESQATETMGGGLIPALIDGLVDNASTKKAEGTVQPVRDALVNYDFPAVLSYSLTSELLRLGWLHPQPVIIDREVAKNWQKNLCEGSTAGAVLFVTGDYAFTPNFEKIILNTKVIMYPHSDNLFAYCEKKSSPGGNPVSKGKCIYRNDNLTAEESLGVSKLKATAAVTMWAENNGARARAALNKIAQDMAKSIAADLVKQDK
jgi:hypothetical protein